MNGHPRGGGACILEAHVLKDSYGKFRRHIFFVSSRKIVIGVEVQAVE
jgi:hypothetical protein